MLNDARVALVCSGHNEHDEESETAKNASIRDSHFQVHSFVCKLDYKDFNVGPRLSFVLFLIIRVSFHPRCIISVTDC